MLKTTAARPQLSNRLLAALPRKDYQRLLPKLEPVDLAFGDVLYQPGDVITHVHFPNNSIISLLSAVTERSTLEVGIVGNEGMAGISIFMGVGVSANKFLVQGAGTAMRMKAESLGSEAGTLTALDRLLRRYSYSLLTQISQSAACNRFHTVNERLARWLLMTHDRSGTDEFQVTQEFMSNMMGVRREGVSKAAGELQRKKLINYSRGVVTILNRPGLEKCACKCYQVIRDSEDSLD
ncbi:MAG: Crp/Fnr family transcriptional regulator [Pyrinomonadaceae bacterium]